MIDHERGVKNILTSAFVFVVVHGVHLEGDHIGGPRAQQSNRTIVQAQLNVGLSFVQDICITTKLENNINPFREHKCLT